MDTRVTIAALMGSKEFTDGLEGLVRKCTEQVVPPPAPEGFAHCDPPVRRVPKCGEWVLGWTAILGDLGSAFIWPRLSIDPDAGTRWILRKLPEPAVLPKPPKEAYEGLPPKGFEWDGEPQAASRYGGPMPEGQWAHSALRYTEATAYGKEYTPYGWWRHIKLKPRRLVFEEVEVRVPKVGDWITYHSDNGFEFYRVRSTGVLRPRQPVWRKVVGE